MSKTVWVINLPEEAEVVVKSGQKVSANDLLAQGSGKDVLAPVGGKIVQIKDKKLKLEFQTKKITGQGLNEFHQWGKICWAPKISYSQLESEYKGKILVVNTENVTPHLLSKALALEVSGLVVFGDELKGSNYSLPILVVKKEQAKKIKGREGVECLLDAGNDRLLIPQKEGSDSEDGQVKEE